MSSASPKILRDNCFSFIWGEAQKTQTKSANDGELVLQLEDILTVAQRGRKTTSEAEQVECLRKIAEKAGWFAGDDKIPPDIEQGFRFINDIAVKGIQA